MEMLERDAAVTEGSANAFYLLVAQIVSELLEARSFSDVSYHMGRILGAKHLAKVSGFTEEQAVMIREAIKPLAEQSFQLSWALRKPYGYAGDFFALETLYENEVSPSSSPLGQLLDRWFLGTQLANGVRDRKNMLSAFIERKVRAHVQVVDEPFRLLSLASGSARELRELPAELLEHMDITLVDQDQRSLDFALSHLPAGVEGLNRNALRLKAKSFRHPFDFVYSFGFFDYLSDGLIEHSLDLCRESLASSGSVLFPLKMDSKFRHWFYDVFMDWRFVKREMDDGFCLAGKAGMTVVELLETENESVVFYHCVPKQI